MYSSNTCTLHVHISLLLFNVYSDSVGRSSVFCSAYNTIEQCKVEGLVDVFQATKAVRMHKPGAVATLVNTTLNYLII